jgi:hypothetical protein
VTFQERGRLKKRLNNRLKSDGYWDQYNELRASLKASGVPESDAWRVAAFPFPPKDGSMAEIVEDAQYADIAAGWQNGRYDAPEASQKNETAAVGLPTMSDPERALAEWESLAAAVGPRISTELEECRWVMANYLMKPSQLKADDVPSAASLSILMWVKMSPANFGDFLRTHNSKLLPDKKSLEYESKFVDDGRDLKLLDDFKKSLEAESRSELSGKIESALATAGIANARWDAFKKKFDLPPDCTCEARRKGWSSVEKWMREVASEFGEPAAAAVSKLWAPIRCWTEQD